MDNKEIIGMLEELAEKLGEEDLQQFVINLAEGYPIQGLENYELVSSVRGEEYSEEGHCEAMFRLYDKYFACEWSYCNYRGDVYEGIVDTLYELRPKQVMVTRYVPVEVKDSDNIFWV